MPVVGDGAGCPMCDASCVWSVQDMSCVMHVVSTGCDASCGPCRM